MNTRRLNRSAGWLKPGGLLLILILSLLGPAIPVARAAGYMVSLKEGSLRQAILAANASAGADTVTFSASGTILLTRPLPAITDPAGLTIDGAGRSITLSGNHLVRVLAVDYSGVLTLRHLTVTGGYNSFGAGVWNGGVLSVTNCTFSENIAPSTGGGIYNYSTGTLNVTSSTFSHNQSQNGAGISNDGMLNVINSTFSENEADLGGGIAGGSIFYGGTLQVTDSTFSGNTASDDGGGLALFSGTGTVADSAFWDNSSERGGGISNLFGDLTVTGSTFSGNSGFSAGGGISNPYGSVMNVSNSTFSANSAPNGGGLSNYGRMTVTNATFSENKAASGGVIYNCCTNNGASLTLQNTIIASSTAANCLNDGALTDGGGNLSWPDTSCPGLNSNPLLGPLQDNGGPTQTHALLAGSPALDAALLANCLATDQRGVSRPQGPECDIGAYELGVEAIAPTIAINTPTVEAIYILGQAVTADYACQDEAGGSGLVSCLGTVPNGSPIDTDTLGGRTFTVEAADNAGNLASLTHSYHVVYDLSGFFQPVDNLPTLNVVKAGVGVPVRFSLSGDQGLAIFAAGNPSSLQIPCPGGTPEDTIEQTVAASSSSLSYDSATLTYTYVWKTSTAWVGTCRQLKLTLNDGSELMAVFKFPG